MDMQIVITKEKAKRLEEIKNGKTYRLFLTKREAKAFTNLLRPSFVLQALSASYESGTETEFKRDYGISKKEAVEMIRMIVSELDRQFKHS